MIHNYKNEFVLFGQIFGEHRTYNYQVNAHHKKTAIHSVLATISLFISLHIQRLIAVILG